MILFRGQRIPDNEFVEGNYRSWKHFNGRCYECVYAIDTENETQLINPDTLQVMTTDGWADIADVEVVRKNPAVSGSVCKHCGCERDKHTVLGMCLDRVKHFEAN